MKEFIPTQYKKEQISIRIPEEVLQRIDRMATRAGISRNELINQCIDYALEHAEEEKK